MQRGQDPNKVDRQPGKADNEGLAVIKIIGGRPMTVDVCQLIKMMKDLQAATAIIAVLAIVTSPAVAWSAVRHAYVIRVSCYATTKSHIDVVDINLNNVVSFGFGANAGSGPSCLESFLKPPGSGSDTGKPSLPPGGKPPDGKPPSGPVQFSTDMPGDMKTFITLILVIKIIGWIVLAADLIFVLFAFLLLLHVFMDASSKVRTLIIMFMCGAALSIFLSFGYGILYVVTCFFIGGSFPIFEFVFAIVDVGVWTYFVIVVNAYRRSIMQSADDGPTVNAIK